MHVHRTVLNTKALICTFLLTAHWSPTRHTHHRGVRAGCLPSADRVHSYRMCHPPAENAAGYDNVINLRHSGSKPKTDL